MDGAEDRVIVNVNDFLEPDLVLEEVSMLHGKARSFFFLL